MTETVVETASVALVAGDRVKIAEQARDAAGYNVPERVLGKVGKLDFLDASVGWYVRPEDGERGAYVGTEYLTKLTEADELRAEIERLTKLVATVTTQRDTVLSEFQDRARTAIVSAAESTYNDADEFDDLLSTLDLEGRLREFNVRVDFQSSFYTTVEATSLSAALGEAGSSDFVRDWVRNNPDGDWLDNVDADEDQ